MGGGRPPHRTGAPLLAGDPHLAFGFPGIWYLARIETPDGVLAGATAPGVPFLVLGHNGHIAWTFTTTGADVQDVFVETPAGDGQYQTPDGPRPFIVREERIKVRGEPDQVLTVRETRHGPVISDLRGSGGPILAVAMANLAPGNTAAAGLLALNQARDVDAAGKAAAMITAPVQNLLVADRERIALYVTGRVPIRRAGDGSAPVPGDGSHDWIGWASGDQLPHIVAPASGRLVNANDRIAPADFPVFLGRDWFGDWRASRIRELLGRSDRHTAADFARMQVDVHSPFARQILPTLLAVPVTEDTARRAQATAARLGRGMTMDAPQPLIFNAWVHHFYGRVLQQAGIAPSDGGPLAEFVAFVLSPAGAHWCGGDCTAMLQAALTDAVGRPHRAASATIRRDGAGARRIRRSSPIRCCVRCPSWARSRRCPSPAPATTPRSIAAARSTNSSNRCTERSIEGCMTSPISTARCSSWLPASPATCSAGTRATSSPAGATVPRSRSARRPDATTATIRLTP